MRTCVPVSDDGTVDPRWGRAACVAIAEIEGGAIVEWAEYRVDWDRLHDESTEGGHHARVARFLREKAVELVVANHMGGGMIDMLESMQIPVELGAGGDAREALLAAAGRHEAASRG